MDDEEFSFIPLAALVANVVQFLVKEEKPNGETDSQKDSRTEPDRHREESGSKVIVK